MITAIGEMRAQGLTPQVRADVHAAITASLERDWPAYLQGLIDRCAIQTQ
ncbi:hypothetical protein [Streptomyces sp. NPDC002580]